MPIENLYIARVTDGLILVRQYNLFSDQMAVTVQQQLQKQFLLAMSNRSPQWSTAAQQVRLAIKWNFSKAKRNPF
jgi:hypothetical protein